MKQSSDVSGLAGKKILVVGAGGLLGSALVAHLLNLEVSVIAADFDMSRTAERLKSLNIEPASTLLTLVSLDLTNETDVKRFFNENSDLDGAVNASYPRNKTYGTDFLDVSYDSFNENLALHLGSSFLFMQQSAAAFIREKRPFSLVNIASIYGVVAPEFDVYEGTTMTMPVEYAAIKSAIIHLNRYSVAYVRDSRFRVNSVSPGGIIDGQPDAFLESYKGHTQGTGMLDSADILGTISFLLSDHSRYITGQNIIVDDGFTV